MTTFLSCLFCKFYGFEGLKSKLEIILLFCFDYDVLNRQELELLEDTKGSSPSYPAQLKAK